MYVNDCIGDTVDTQLRLVSALGIKWQTGLLEHPQAYLHSTLCTQASRFSPLLPCPYFRADWLQMNEFVTRNSKTSPDLYHVDPDRFSESQGVGILQRPPLQHPSLRSIPQHPSLAPGPGPGAMEASGSSLSVCLTLSACFCHYFANVHRDRSITVEILLRVLCSS